MATRKGKLVYVEVGTEMLCPICRNPLKEIIEVPADEIYSDEEQELLVGKRLGYRCPECGGEFNIRFEFEDPD